MTTRRAREESQIEKKVTQYAKTLGWRPRKMAFVGRRGCPDRWFKRAPNQLVIVEFKDPDGELSVSQKREVQWLENNGFNVFVVDSVAQGVGVFDQFESK